jgi:hypothetical protein
LRFIAFKKFDQLIKMELHLYCRNEAEAGAAEEQPARNTFGLWGILGL